MTVKISIPATLVLGGSVGRQTIGSLGSSEDSNGSLKKPTFSERHPKVVRSATVVAYIFSVSLVAIVLSAYYVVMWTPTPPRSDARKPSNTTVVPCRVPLGEEHQGYYRRSPYSTKHYGYSYHKRPPLIIERPPPPLPEPEAQVSSDNSSLEQSEDSISSNIANNVTAERSRVPPESIPVPTNASHSLVSSSSSPTRDSILLQKIILNSKRMVKQETAAPDGSGR